MRKVEVRIKTPFGEIVAEGESAQEVLDVLKSFPESFVEDVSNVVSGRLVSSSGQLKGVVEFTNEGPVIVARENLTHYEAIGLVLYASEGRRNTAAVVQRLLESSGIKCMVPARLNEMTKRGQVFKPDLGRPEFKLTVQGERWVEDDVLARFRGKMG